MISCLKQSISCWWTVMLSPSYTAESEGEFCVAPWLSIHLVSCEVHVLKWCFKFVLKLWIVGRLQGGPVTIHTVCLAAPAWRWASGWKTWTWQLKWPRNPLRNPTCFWTTPYATAPTVSAVSHTLESSQVLSLVHVSPCKFDDANGVFYNSYANSELLCSCRVLVQVNMLVFLGWCSQ